MYTHSHRPTHAIPRTALNTHTSAAWRCMMAVTSGCGVHALRRHPVLMTLAFAVFMAEAVLTYQAPLLSSWPR